MTPHHYLLVNMSSTSKKHAALMTGPLGRKRADALPGIGNVLGRRLEAEGYYKVQELHTPL